MDSSRVRFISCIALAPTTFYYIVGSLFLVLGLAGEVKACFAPDDYCDLENLIRHSSLLAGGLSLVPLWLLIFDVVPESRLRRVGLALALAPGVVETGWILSTSRPELGSLLFLVPLLLVLLHIPKLAKSSVAV